MTGRASGMEVPDTHYATADDGVSIAYQVFGRGDEPLVVVPGTVSHVELLWEVPSYRYLYERLAGVARVVTFDNRGTGLSDREVGTGTLERRVDDIRAVMDSAGIERAAVLAASEGGPLAVMSTATHPDRVGRLALLNAYAYGPRCRDHPRAEAAARAAERAGPPRGRVGHRAGGGDVARAPSRTATSAGASSGAPARRPGWWPTCGRTSRSTCGRCSAPCRSPRSSCTGATTR